MALTSKDLKIKKCQQVLTDAQKKILHDMPVVVKVYAPAPRKKEVTVK